jgi:hypothetical protein
VIEIEISANEELADWQEIYVKDSQGERHDYIFSKVDDCTYFGYVDLRVYPFGIATIYARMKDEVFNLSELASVAIYIGYIKNKPYAVVFHSEDIPKLSMVENTAHLDMVEMGAKLGIHEDTPNLDLYDNRKVMLGVDK